MTGSKLGRSAACVTCGVSLLFPQRIALFHYSENYNITTNITAFLYGSMVNYVPSNRLQLWVVPMVSRVLVPSIFLRKTKALDTISTYPNPPTLPPC